MSLTFYLHIFFFSASLCTQFGAELPYRVAVLNASCIRVFRRATTLPLKPPLTLANVELCRAQFSAPAIWIQLAFLGMWFKFSAFYSGGDLGEREEGMIDDCGNKMYESQ